MGSVFAFGVAGTDELSGREVGARFIGALQLASHLANIGDARTLVLHPASTTHQQLSSEQLAAGGVKEDLIRISVGLEDAADIIWDLDQALTAASGRNREGGVVGPEAILEDAARQILEQDISATGAHEGGRA